MMLRACQLLASCRRPDLQLMPSRYPHHRGCLRLWRMKTPFLLGTLLLGMTTVSAQAQTTPVTLNFYSGGDVNVKDLWENNLLPLYQKTHPNVKINLVFSLARRQQSSHHRPDGRRQEGRQVSGIDMLEGPVDDAGKRRPDGQALGAESAAARPRQPRTWSTAPTATACLTAQQRGAGLRQQPGQEPAQDADGADRLDCQRTPASSPTTRPTPAAAATPS